MELGEAVGGRGFQDVGEEAADEQLLKLLAREVQLSDYFQDVLRLPIGLVSMPVLLQRRLTFCETGHRLGGRKVPYNFRGTIAKERFMTAFVTFESPFFPCGGVAAVMSRMPKTVAEILNKKVSVFTPFHQQMQKKFQEDRRKTERMRSFQFPPWGVAGVEIYRDDKIPNVDWYLLSLEDERFFAGRQHPYDVGRTAAEQAAILRFDALVFGKLVASVLGVDNNKTPLTLYLQDWQAATVVLALASNEQLSLCPSYVVLHNSYDSGGMSDSELWKAGINPNACPGPEHHSQASVLQRALPLLKRPIMTVSSQFALDLVSDPLQTQVMAPHLQQFLAGNVVDTPNAAFITCAVPVDVLRDLEQGTATMLLEWKQGRREFFMRGIWQLDRNDKSRPIWGNQDSFEYDRPLFFMSGRDDTRQKGYDVACAAIRMILDANYKLSFVLFPMPGDEGLAGLKFVQDLAEKYPQGVLALPFRLPREQAEVYSAGMQGADFGLMPSFYEPFGMANEFYMNGTVGIARLTGGSGEQITLETGYLYRESESDSLIDDWRQINAANYDPTGCWGQNRIKERETCTLFQDMAYALAHKIKLAENLARRSDYGQVLLRGIKHIENNFSWERSARKLLDVTGAK